MAEVEVTGLSDEVDTEHLTLYFENKRISGGGPLLSCTRDGTEATLTFQNLTDAERVLSKSEHKVSAVILHLRRPAPWDPGKLALCGLNPNTSDVLLEIYVENVSEREKFCIQRSTDGTTALVIFQEPLSETEVESMTQRVGARKLNEASISVKRVRVPCELLVENLVPQISAELLELYLESRRGGGGRVHSVTMLTGRPAAVVSFHDWQVVRDVLNKEHCLLDSQLKFSLYYPKLLGLPTTHGSETQEQESVQGMRQDCTTHRSVQLMEQSTDRGEQSNSKEQLSRPERSQRQQSTVDSQQSEKKQICEVERPPRAEIRQPSAADRQHNGQLPTDGHQCSVQLQDEISVHVGAFKTEDRSVTMVGNAEQVDTEVSMQPAQLRFLQERHHELLAGMDEVTIVPLEHEDKTGFMVSGTAPICQSVAELLHTLVSSLSTSSVLLEYPGISRFLLEPDGQQILQAIESQYNCVIDTSQLSLKALDSEYVDPWSYVPDVLPTKIMTDESPPQEELLQPADMEGIRVLASLLQNTSSVDNGMTCQSSEEEPQLQSSSIGLNISPEDTELDIYSESTSCDKDDDENVVDKELEKAFAMSRVEFQERELDEEAELLLAIQRSMDVRQLSTQEEDEAIKRALEMSLREQVLEETEESLQIALKRSLTANRADGEMVNDDQGSTLEEIEQALGTAQLIVVAEEKNELMAACMALRKAVKGKLCKESVEAIVDLHIKNSGILSALQRKHRVSITVGNRQIVIEGFSSSPSNCHQELLEIISFLQEKNRRTEDQDVQQLPYHVTYKRPRTSDNVQIGVEFVSVAEDSEEFASIVKPFYNTLEELENCIQILEVQRVHNTLLDNQYELKKRSVEASDTRKPVERVLYHGTTESSAMEICHHGFNRSFCGKNASLYGQGVYFAVKAVLSARDNYSPPTDVGKKYVLVAKVLTGNFTVGKADMRAPPYLPDSTGTALRRYDSLVDNHHNPSIFVIFNDTQAYPHYLITCCRSK